MLTACACGCLVSAVSVGHSSFTGAVSKAFTLQYNRNFSFNWSCAIILTASSILLHQVRTQQDVNLSSLPHRQLTDVFTLFEINLSDVGLDLPVISAVRAVPVTQSGRASGFCYWFDAECQGGHVISSYSEEGTTSQAAVLLRDPHSVQLGTCLKVVGSCTDSTIDIWLDSVKATEAEH